jgi:hypothetical protein
MSFAFFCKRGNVKFGFWLLMREYLTTSDIGRMCGGVTAQQVRNWWDSGQLVGVAELLNPSAKHLRFRKTARLESWCAGKANNARRRERPLDYKRWWELVAEEKKLSEILGGYQPTWSLPEMMELIRLKPARMNFEEYLKVAGIEQMKSKIRALRGKGDDSH